MHTTGAVSVTMLESFSALELAYLDSYFGEK
jgi:hypothetical protein